MIVIVNYNMGNLHSVKKKLDRLNVDSIISSDTNAILNADKLILPGVGHFGKAMEHLTNSGLKEALNEAVINRSTPILGICLGMQLMARVSFESNDPKGSEGLGWFDAAVVKLHVKDALRFKIPHTGWNRVIPQKSDLLLESLPEPAEFYFVHAFHFDAHDPEDILTTTHYESTFISAVSKGHIYGVQFHPEKSHDIGMKLLENFITL
jgi:glutamine amidotransferase